MKPVMRCEWCRYSDDKRNGTLLCYRRAGPSLVETTADDGCTLGERRPVREKNCGNCQHEAWVCARCSRSLFPLQDYWTPKTGVSHE